MKDMKNGARIFSILIFICLFNLTYLFNLKLTEENHTALSNPSTTTIKKEPSDYQYNKAFHPSQFKYQFKDIKDKINYGLFLENKPAFVKPTLETETESTLRHLEDVNTLSNVGIIDLKQNGDSTKRMRTFKYIIDKLRRASSKFIIYPFAFKHTPPQTPENQSPTETSYTNGAVLSVDPDTFPDNIDFIKTTEISIGKAKALYDMHIAIMKMEEQMDSINKRDLFTESDEYCSFFTTYLSKSSTCLVGQTEFEQYKKSNPYRGAVMYVTPEDLLNNTLFTSNDNTKNEFGLLILADYIYGTDDDIINKITAQGVEKIKQFINQGGHVLASGKSGYLLEKMGLINSGSYEVSKFLTSTATDSKVDITGCENTGNNNVNDASVSFEKQLICMDVQSKSFLQTAFHMKSYSDLTLHLSVDARSQGLQFKTAEGYDEAIDPSITSFPFVLTKSYGKGKIIIMNANHLSKTTAYPNLMANILFNSMSKTIIFNSYINFSKDNPDLPVPGGEGGIYINSVVEFRNLHDYDLQNIELYVYLPLNVTFVNYNTNLCTLSTDTIPEFGELNSMNMTSHLKCAVSTLTKFQMIKSEMKLEILDQGVTQKLTDIPILYPIIKYLDTQTQEQILLDDGATLVQASRAAVLRGTLNPDPSSFYPLPGRGAFADTVLNVENKENTIAYDVDFISIIPLVSPIFDGINQADVIELCQIYHNYYESYNYSYPWRTTGTDQDYIDYQFLSNKDIVMVAEWDTPTKINKKMRSEANLPDVSGFNGDIYLENGNYSTVIDNSQLVLHQMYFVDADLFYEHATQRAMTFVDTSKENGAKAQYENGIPEHLKDPVNPNKTKKYIPFSRVDIFFYPADEYQLPNGLNDSFLLSVDKYDGVYDPAKQTDGKLGAARAYKIKKGTFDSTKANRDERLVPNEYSNVLKQYNKHKQYDPTNATAMAELERISNGDLKLTHYLIPVIDPEIVRPDSMVSFTPDTNNAQNIPKEGYLNGYPEVRFIYGHSIKIVVAPEISRQGGKLIITLPSDAQFASSDPVKDELITMSADQIALNETIYDPATNQITMVFKRGLMPNEAYGKPSKLEIDLEGINHERNFTVDVVLYEMKYDVTSPETNYEIYNLISETLFPKTYTAAYIPFFRLPALTVHNHMNRNNATTIREYELLQPYARYGIYFQELLRHRTIWGSAEAHHVTDPGLQAINGGFSVLSNVGISSIPFVEYVTHGTGLVIPAGTHTSRIDWTDVWGRRWSQPLRSLFPDIPPIPPPLRNFMMSTTYEVLSKDGKERFIKWPSDEEAVIHVQMKFLNNYPKYFLPTTCPANRLPFAKTNPRGYERDRVFTTPDFTLLDAPNDRTQYAHFGFSSVYGKCYTNEGSLLGGREINSTVINNMNYAMTCAATNDPETIKNCTDELKAQNNPTMNRRTSTDVDNKWNYSPTVEKFYPQGYIKDNMWDLTHYDYDDNAMDKGYKYHMDNNLPSLDVGPPQNPAYYKPHNLVAFPIYKGLGYEIDYDSTFTLKQFEPYHGWWSDNLQNKDNTLVAGQKYSNDVSVDKNSLLAESDWIDASQLTLSETQKKVIDERLKNIYVCLFNRHRVKTASNQDIYAYTNNVYENNVIPIINELDQDSPEYTNYNCDNSKFMYTPVNISKVDNRIETPTDRDWLYFGINLRGGARETINVLMKMKPFEDRKYEGITKVQDGGRFTYWNPANGPNSFLIVDNVVNTVEAYRIDHDLNSTIIPTTLPTFNSISLQLHTIADTNEILREYPLSTYTNSHGYGDATITVYVGGSEDTSAKLNPGEYTHIKIAFYNNAGFDWNLHEDAIIFENRSVEAINGNDLFMGLNHTIKAPLAYNFMKLEIPEEIKPYVAIAPSDHNIDVASMFFDLEYFNVLTIRDGFEGDYFYRLNISENFPDVYKGRLWEIKVKIDESYFDRLPGYNDPTKNGFHNYTLEIPSIKFGVKYGDTHSKYKGKVFYTLGRATNITVSFKIYYTFEIQQVKIITKEEVEQLEIKGFTGENQTALVEFFNNLTFNNSLKFNIVEKENEKYKEVIVDMSEHFDYFPKENISSGLPDEAEFTIISLSSASQIPYGQMNIMNKAKVNFVDPRGLTKVSKIVEPSNRYADVKGPWVEIVCTQMIMKLDESGKFYESVDQRVFEGETAYIRVNVTASNKGSAPSYNTVYTFTIASGVNVLTELIEGIYPYKIETLSNGEQRLDLLTNETINEGTKSSKTLYLQVVGTNNALRTLATSGSKTLISKVEVRLQQLSDSTDSLVTESLTLNYKLSYTQGVRENVELQINAIGTFTEPQYSLKATANPSTTTSGNPMQFMFSRRTQTTTLSEWVVIQDKSETDSLIDIPLKFEDIGDLDTYTVYYKVESFDGNKFIASSTYSVTESKLKNIEKENEGTAFPWWIIVVAVIAVVVVSIVTIVVCVIKKKNSNEDKVDDLHKFQQPKEKQNNRLKFPKQNKATTNEYRSDRPIFKGDDVRIHRYDESGQIEIDKL